RERPRTGASSAEPRKDDAPQFDGESHRNCFDMDYDRIVYSSSLRRLQDKAQVFPLQENDFTRTRLTHSLECSAIGRSLGNKVGRWLETSDVAYGPGHAGELATLLQVAGLVHDLGNPPFGHYGEDVIKAWFANPGNAPQLQGPGRNDFIFYDGNAQTIRILTRLQFLKDRHGINFCYGTLAALMKYPWDSSDEMAASRKKFGFFQSEKALCRKVMEETGLIGRHPATWLLEAADDISYLFADLEDAVKKGHAPWGRLSAELMGYKAQGVWAGHEKRKARLAGDFERLEDSGLPPGEQDQLASQYFKLAGQVMCIDAVFSEFVENYQDIMLGRYRRKSLLDAPSIKALVGLVRGWCVDYAYTNSEVLALELIGKSVLSSLLDRFVPAILDDSAGDVRTDCGKISRLISRNFEYVQKLDEESRYQKDKILDPYQRVQLVIDFISGMTDSYALNLHKKLLGMILP
ncbi:dNTP triphosphohydrolase, partial [Deltaproteobacteria bacterium OttesenSCG-928-K17]|nr:dNTP triphosphohydrolase [Deltaproteobacteria bacterium OttesenSCG-928-K17]